MGSGGLLVKHLPSLEALTDIDDNRLLAELEICHVLEKLARVRDIVDRADHILTTVLACGPAVGELVTEAEACSAIDERLASAILASLRKR